MVAGYRACWQATQMLVRPLMKLARSLKTNSPAQLFSGSSCELRHAFRPCWIRPPLPFFFSQWLKFLLPKSPYNSPQQGKGRLFAHCRRRLSESAADYNIGYYCNLLFQWKRQFYEKETCLYATPGAIDRLQVVSTPHSQDYANS